MAIYGNLFSDPSTGGVSTTLATPLTYYAIPFAAESSVQSDVSFVSSGGHYQGVRVQGSASVRVSAIIYAVKSGAGFGDELFVAIYQNGVRVNAPQVQSAQAFTATTNLSISVDITATANSGDVFEAYVSFDGPSAHLTLSVSGSLTIQSLGASTSQATVAPTWWINPIAGNDSNSGTTEEQPLKTWAHLQSIFGRWTTLSSAVGAAGVITVNLLNDLPASDPITFYNYLGNTAGSSGTGVGFLVQGQVKNPSYSGTITSVVANNPATNTPDQVHVNGATWTPYIGLAIVATVSPGNTVRAYIAADLGGGVAQVSQWVSSTGTGFMPAGTTNFAAAPSAGNAFVVVDYTNVVLNSALYAGSDMAFLALPTATSADGQFFFANIHAIVPPGNTNSRSSLVYETSGASSACFFPFDCIFDCQLEWAGSGHSGNLSNCCFTDCEFIDGGAGITEFFGLHVPTVNGQGGINATLGSNLNICGNTMFVGTASPADIQVSGNAQISSASFWNCNLVIYLFEPGANVILNQSGGGPLGESNAVPLWGTGNNNMFFWTGTNFFILQMTNAPAADILPTITFNGAGTTIPAGTVAIIGPEASQDVINSDPSYCTNAFAFVPSTASYNSAQSLTWANLNKLPDSDGFLIISEADVITGGTVKIANAGRPDNQTLLTWQSLVF